MQLPLFSCERLLVGFPCLQPNVQESDGELDKERINTDEAGRLI